jgi:hypothetical protein
MTKRGGANIVIGEPCDKGHDGRRYSRSNICVTCARARRKPSVTTRFPKSFRPKSLDEMRAALRKEVAEIMRAPL